MIAVKLTKFNLTVIRVSPTALDVAPKLSEDRR